MPQNRHRTLLGELDPSTLNMRGEPAMMRSAWRRWVGQTWRVESIGAMNGPLESFCKLSGTPRPGHFESNLRSLHGVGLSAGGKICGGRYVGSSRRKRARWESHPQGALAETIRGIAVGGHHFRNGCQKLVSSPPTLGKYPRHRRRGDFLGCVMGMGFANTPRPEAHGLVSGVLLSGLSLDVFHELGDPGCSDS